jgi:hypothetical protein
LKFDEGRMTKKKKVREQKKTQAKKKGSENTKFKEK